jgi:hypothetical protein
VGTHCAVRHRSVIYLANLSGTGGRQSESQALGTAEAQARALAHVRLHCIIAISCDARSFARDARILQDGGWRLTSLTIVDQFRWTTHLESFAMFCR